MATLGNAFLAKTSTPFCCDICDYTTVRRYNYKIHLESVRHLGNAKLAKTSTTFFSSKTDDNLVSPMCSEKQLMLRQHFGNAKLAKTSKTYKCDNCEKIYKNRSGLWRHMKQCISSDSIRNLNLQCQSSFDDITNTDLIMMLIKENSELKSMMSQVIEKGTHTTIINNNTNSHNKSFNLNVFLNETCKHAMNLTEFVDSIKIQLSDLITVGELGYVDGISKIIVKNLNNIDEKVRPIHCTDKKRETYYVKDKGQWEKEDENKTKLKRFVKNVADKNIRELPQYREKFPDYNDSDSLHSDEHSKIVIESMVSDISKDEKIIRNISTVTTIHK